MNLISRPVPRPRVLSVYYALANKVDVHNQGRQDLIHLERSWPTQNCWFRNFCTGMGMVAENAYRHLRNVESGRLTHDVFLRRLAHQLGTIKTLCKPNREIVERTRSERATSPVPSLSLRVVSPVGGAAAERPVSPELMTFDGKPHKQHTAESSRNCMWCYRLHKARSGTTNHCGDCNERFCNKQTTGRDCFDLHKKHGLPPLNLKKQGEQLRLKWGLIAAADLNNIKKHANAKAMKKIAVEREAKRSKTEHR